MVMLEFGCVVWYKSYLGYLDVGFLLGVFYVWWIGWLVYGLMVSDIGWMGGE